MKCPHCGMNVRDNTAVCGYCGEKIAKHPEKPSTGAPAAGIPVSERGGQKTEDQADAEEEEGGGLSAILHPGEQVLIGSLNISVKKFFFHSYLTNQRIFLIDTQEKKIRVTAKDIARETIAGSNIEFSETSDPVLVLSIRSPDDEIKTMKLVFVQNGTDRSREIDEWIALMHEEKQSKKSAPPEPEEEPVREDEEEPGFALPERRVPQKQELQPVRKPVKDHEKQPPVKKLLSLYKIPEEQEVVRAAESSHRPQVRQTSEPVRRPVVTRDTGGQPPARELEVQPIRKPGVQSAMKIAMQPARQPASIPVKRTAIEHVHRPQPEPEPEQAPARRPVVSEYARDTRYERAPERAHERSHERYEEKPEPEEPAAGTPQFCHHCGKRLPHEANFCPGCGTRLNRHQAPAAPSPAHRTLPREKVIAARQEDSDEDEDEGLASEKPVPAKPLAKKAPRGSEMTILHKFLRR